MKYAVIVMLAVYLVTFGCNPKPEEEKKSGHETVEHATAHKAPAAPAEAHHAAAPAEHVETHTAPAAPADVVLEGNQDVVENAAEPQNEWEKIAQSAATTVLALMTAEDTPAAADGAEVEAAPAVVEEEVVVAEC